MEARLRANLLRATPVFAGTPAPTAPQARPNPEAQALVHPCFTRGQQFEGLAQRNPTFLALPVGLRRASMSSQVISPLPAAPDPTYRLART